jgi:AcrR family transcriptional regulator
LLYYHNGLGLRESKKQQTREQIATAAMGLFAQRGFDGVTVAEIADAAGVSEKTVFNYFPTKEDVFFDETPARLAALAAAVRERAPGVSAVAALHALQARSADRLASPQFATFARIIEQSPALQMKELEVMAQFATMLSETLRTELGVPELDARIAANALVGAHWQVFRNARRAALEGRHGPAAAKRLRAELDRAYALLERGLGSLEP